MKLSLFRYSEKWRLQLYALLLAVLHVNSAWGAETFFDKVLSVGKSQDVQDMLENFSASFPAILNLVTGTAYLLGLIFAVRALYYFKVYGELRTMMSSNANLRAPLTYLLVAAVFIFFPTTLDVLLQTTFGNPDVTPLSYASETSSPDFGRGMKAVLAFIQLIGYIAFIRGWVIISHTAQQGGRDTIGKGIIHIVGGILAINVVGTRDVLWQTFGFS